LLNQPAVWTVWALEAKKAEGVAEKEAQNRATRRANRKR
jgi:hypothetical protein